MQKKDLAKEMAELQALLATLTAGQAVTKVEEPKAEAEGTVTAGFRISPNVENTEKYGTEYSFIKFVDANGKGLPSAPSKDDELGYSTKKFLDTYRYGQQGKGKFRWNRGARAFSGQTAFIPQIVKDHEVK